MRQGLPSSYLKVPLPEPFLSKVVPNIKDVAELRVSLFLLWRLHEAPGYPAAVPEREVVEHRWLRGVDAERGLALALRRGTFLARAEGGQRWIALNDEVGRRWVEGGGTERASARANAFELHERHFGLVPPALVDELKEAELVYPGDWIERAFGIAVENEARSWRYVVSILRRWEREEKPRGASGRHPDADRLRRPGQYADYVEY